MASRETIVDCLESSLTTIDIEYLRRLASLLVDVFQVALSYLSMATLSDAYRRTVYCGHSRVFSRGFTRRGIIEVAIGWK